MRRLILFFILSVLLVGCDNSSTKDKGKTVETHKEVDKLSEYDAITDSIMSDTANVALYVKRAQVNLANERVSMAIKDINSALSINKKDIDALLVLADIYYALGDEDNILLTLNKATEYAPLDTRPIIKLSELSFLQGNIRMAGAYVDKALELDRFNPRAYFMRGMIQLSNNDTVNALKNFMTSRLQQDDFIDPIIQIAHIYAAKGDTIAKAFFEEAIRVAPQDYTLYYDYAMYLQENDYPEEALSYYDTLLNIIPNNPDFIYNKGYVYLVYLEDTQNALECFDKVLQIDPTSINALFNKGRTYELMGDFINAKSIYRQILRRDPDYQLAVDAINRLGE